MATETTPASAWLGGHYATRLRDVTHDISALDSTGWWVVVATYEGDITCARFDDVRANVNAREIARSHAGDRWVAPEPEAWRSSLDSAAYQKAVEDVRGQIAIGDFYQVNICRLMQARLPDPIFGASVAALSQYCANQNPAPYQGFVDLPNIPVPIKLASASPELFLRRQGDHVVTAPIKGTAESAEALTTKDQAENIMIVDLMRNDLGRVCEPGSVTAPKLLDVEEHPGLVHLVSHVAGRLNQNVQWEAIFASLFPAGSVTGAPKIAAMSAIERLEPVARGPYCGAFGWVNADTKEAQLAVGIRTFFITEDILNFGSGAGITYASDPAKEWAETQLKSARLISIASAATRAA